MTLLDLALLLALLAPAIGISYAGWHYLKGGKKHLDATMNHILNSERRLGLWYQAPTSGSPS